MKEPRRNKRKNNKNQIPCKALNLPYREFLICLPIKELPHIKLGRSYSSEMGRLSSNPTSTLEEVTAKERPIFKITHIRFGIAGKNIRLTFAQMYDKIHPRIDLPPSARKELSYGQTDRKAAADL